MRKRSRGGRKTFLSYSLQRVTNLAAGVVLGLDEKGALVEDLLNLLALRLRLGLVVGIHLTQPLALSAQFRHPPRRLVQQRGNLRVDRGWVNE